MSFLAQAFQSSVATNTFSTMSRLNSTDVSLNTAGIFTGQFEFCGQYSVIQVNVSSDQDTTLFVKQSYDGTTQNIVAEAQYDISGGNNPFFLGDTKFTYITYPFYRIEVVNTGGAPMTKLFVSTKLTLTSPPPTTDPISGALDVVITNPTTSAGDLIVNGTASSATRSILNATIGNWYRVASVGTTTGAQWNEAGAIVGSQAVPDVGRLFKLLSYVPGTGLLYDVEYTDTLIPSGVQDISGSVHLLAAADPALTVGKVRVADFYGDPITTTAGNLNVNINAISTATALHTIVDSGSVDISGQYVLTSPEGQNTDFAFYPDATNSTASIYADGDQPVQTTAAGWVYTNPGTGTNKINWYVFQDVTLPQYLVSEMDSIYFVISQLTPATTLPFVGFYTMPNGIDDVVPLFAKSKLVFAPSNAVPTAQGEYLLYVKSDPVHIRPEITNRYELTFVAGQSTKTLAQAAGERLSLATISTNSTDPAGSNYFLFQQYGITWAKTSVPLPVNNGLLDCNIVSQAPVSLLAGTADIGYVRLTAENLLSNPSTFANLQIVGANLEVEDQQAIGFLTSIDGYSNSINTSTTSIASSNVSMESRLVNIDTKMITLSNTASTKTLTQTGANWTTDYTTLQSLTLSNVGGLVFSYVKLYNKATAPDQNDTPVMTLPLNHETVQQVVCNSLLFDLGIGVRATNAFVANDNTAPSGTVYATAFYKNG